MKNTFGKQLYSAQNNAKSRMMILASNMDTAINIAFKNKLVKDVNQLTISDISEDYLTQSRLEKGLNFDELKEGKFSAVYQGKDCKWLTT